MKYKLIKTYPLCYIKLGYIIDTNKSYSGCKGIYDWILSNPKEAKEFWEPVIEKDYEILSLICNQNSICPKSIWEIKDYIRECPNSKYPNHIMDIHSVKRNDGEIFTIGDNTENGIIKYFKIDFKSNLLVIGYKDCEDILEFIKHIKQPIFQTEDGVDIYIGDEYYCPNIDDNWIIYNYFATEKLIGYTQPYKCFSTLEKAEEYILLNKPCLSLKDVASIYISADKPITDTTSFSAQNRRIQDLVKSKIQQSV